MNSLPYVDDRSESDLEAEHADRTIRELRETVAILRAENVTLSRDLEVTRRLLQAVSEFAPKSTELAERIREALKAPVDVGAEAPF